MGWVVGASFMFPPPLSYGPVYTVNGILLKYESLSLNVEYFQFNGIVCYKTFISPRLTI